MRNIKNLLSTVAVCAVMALIANVPASLTTSVQHAVVTGHTHAILLTDGQETHGHKRVSLVAV